MKKDIFYNHLLNFFLKKDIKIILEGKEIKTLKKIKYFYTLLKLFEISFAALTNKITLPGIGQFYFISNKKKYSKFNSYKFSNSDVLRKFFNNNSDRLSSEDLDNLEECDFFNKLNILIDDLYKFKNKKRISKKMVSDNQDYDETITIN